MNTFIWKPAFKAIVNVNQCGLNGDLMVVLIVSRFESQQDLGGMIDLAMLKTL